MKQTDIIERLFDLLEKSMTETNSLAVRVSAIEEKMQEIEAVWPQIQENQNGTN